MPDDVEAAIDAYRRDQFVPPSLTVVIEAALRDFFAVRGYLSRGRPLWIEPAPSGSGRRDVSIEHDRSFNEW